MSSEDIQGRKVTSGPVFVRSVLADYYKCAAALMLVTIPVVLAIEWLPHSPQGSTKPGPLLIVGAFLVVLSLAGMRWLKLSSLTGRWTLRFALGFGALFCTVALASI